MEPMSLMKYALCALLCIAALSMTAEGHGAWTTPRARGTLATFSLNLPDLKIPGMPRDDCPHCLNGGGKGTVMAEANNNWRPWEPLSKTKPFRRDAGLCGDPAKGPHDHMKGGKFGPPKAYPYSAVYKAGQVVEFVVDVTTHHNGFFEFFICNVGDCGGDISERCFKENKCRQLMRVKTPECESQNSMECGPVDEKHPGRWYMPCRKGGHVGQHFMGGKFMRYKIPDRFICQDCVMQWYWATANSCNPPGFIEYFQRFPMAKWGRCPGDGGAFGARNPVLSKCGGPTFPEEFWMCADVRVTGNGVSAPSGGAPQEPEPKKQQPERPRAQPSPKAKEPEPEPKASPSPEAVSGDKTANDCQKKLEFSEPNETKPDPKTAKCASRWKQCGGKNFSGPTECCDKRFECVTLNAWYAQCKAPPRRRRRWRRN